MVLERQTVDDSEQKDQDLSNGTGFVTNGQVLAKLQGMNDLS